MKTKGSWILIGLLLSACRSSTDAPTVTLSPLNPTTVDDLVATVDNCDDCKYRWFKGGESQGEITGDTVSANLTTKGETWSLVVTAQLEDGTEGLPGEAEALIVNSPPLLGELSISPSEEVYTNDILTASIDANDPDDDEFSFSYAWTVDGNAVDADGETLDGGVYFDKGQEVSVTVTVTDREDEAQVSSEAISVLNSLPSKPGVTVELATCAVLEFDGSSIAVVPADSTLKYGTAFTFEGWFRWDDINTGWTDFQQLFAQGWNPNAGEIVLSLAVDGSEAACGESGMGLRLTWASAGSSNCMGIPGLTAQTWQHVAIVYDQGRITAFIDGVEEASQTVSSAPYSGGGTSLGIGAIDYESGASPVKGFGGAIRDFRISDVARYSGDFTPPSAIKGDTDTQLLLKLGEGTGSTVQDSSGNANHGSIQNANWESECDGLLGMEGLVCVIEAHSEDLDDDEITYTFAWVVDGDTFEDAETTEYEGDTVPEGVIEEEETWTCTVTPNDGEEDGEEASASLRTVAAVPVWEEEKPSTEPPGVYAGAMAYDPISGFVLHFGGQKKDYPSGTSSETWVWDGEEWTQLFPDHSPPARGAAGIAYDDSMEGLVLFGGIQYDGSYEGQRYADTWFWDGNDWTEMNSTGGPSKRISVLVENPLGGVFLYGGNGCKDQKCVYSDSFVFKDGVWSEVFPSTSPGQLSGHYLAYDEADGLVELYSPLLANSVWNWNGTSWSEVTHQGGPSVDSVRLVYDPRRDQTMLFSGYANNQYSTDTWAWDGASWSILDLQESPAARNGYAWAFDSFNEEVVLFAGQSTATSSSDPYNFHSDTWTLK